MATEQIPTTLIADDAVTNAKIGADAVSTTEIANDASISTSGNIATTGSGTLTVAGASTFSGGIANSGTITAGTLGDSVVVPATTGGWKLLNRTAISGSPTQVEFINGTGGVVIDSSTYEMYQFRFSGIGCVTDVCNISLQVGTSSSYLTTGYYHLAGIDRNAGGASNTRAATNYTHLPIGMYGASNATAERPYLATVDMSLKPNHYAVFTFITSYYQDNNYYTNHRGGGLPKGSSYYGDDIDRIKFFWHSNYSSSSTGSFQTWQNEGSIALYGLKTS